MAASPASLRRKIASAQDLQAVVRAMKAQAAAGIGQYERSVAALGEYAGTVDRALGACLRQASTCATAMAGTAATGGRPTRVVRAVVFGSDQGLVGRFNEVLQSHVSAAASSWPESIEFWAVGERMHATLVAADMSVASVFEVPPSVQAITGLVTQILTRLVEQSDAHKQPLASAELHLFHNRPASGATFAPVDQRLLPLDRAWQADLIGRKWPTAMRPEVMGHLTPTLEAVIAEHLFVSIFRACAESLASENASRLAAMDRADRNIDTLLGTLQYEFHRLRQEKIDEELSDVISGFKALSGQK
jgi:F-type H+-transporting ATPase subunit gamma